MRHTFILKRMRPLQLLLALMLFSVGAKAQFPAPYCNFALSNSMEPITLVNFAGINQTTSNTVTTGAVTNGIGLINYLSVTGNVIQGFTYPSIMQGNTDGTYTNYFTIFIDWNQNNSFAEANEIFQVGNVNSSNGIDGIQATGSVTVPANALLGSTRMRVVKKFSTATVDPCASTWGQAQDYTIIVGAPAPCVAPPAAPTALNLTAGVTVVNGNFTAASPASDNYLIVRTPGSTALNTNPVDGSAYTVGSALGNGTVVGITNTTTFTNTGLAVNTTYTYTIFSMNSACSGGPLYNTAPVMSSVSTASAFAYTWAPTSGSADATVPGNWIPVRNAMDPTDTLYFTNGGSSTITNLATSTVAKIAVKNNTTIVANSAATATITIAKELAVDAGSTLELAGSNGITLAFASANAPQTSSINGMLNMSGTGTCAYNATNSITTVGSTGIVTVTNTGSMTGALANLFFNAGSTFNLARNGGAVPSATYNATSTVNITGVTSTALIPAAKMGTVIWNCPNQTVVNSWSSTVDTIYGNLTIVNTGTSRVEGGNNPDIQVIGNFVQDGGIFAVGNYTSGVGLLDVFGTLDLNAGTLLLNSNTAGGATYQLRANTNFNQAAGHIIDRLNTVAGTVNTITFAGTTPIQVNMLGAVNNNISFALNNPAGGVLNNVVPINLNAVNSIIRGAWSGTGMFTYNQTASSVSYNGTTAQTTTDFEFPASGGPTALILNNTGITPVTLHAPRTITTAFTLTAGKLLTTNTNLLTLSSAITAPPAGSATSYVIGPLALQVNSAANLTRTFAVGDAGGYRPVTLAAFNSGGSLQTFSAQVIPGNSGGTGAGFNLNPARYFQISNINAISSTTTPTILLGYGTDDAVGAPATAVIGQSITANGSYVSLGQSANTASSVTSSTTSPLTASAGQYFVIGNTASLPKTWDGGAATTNWADAANWAPDGVPTCTEDIIIGNATVSLSATAQCQNLVLGNGAIINTPAGSNLTVGCNTPSGGNKLITFTSGSTLNLAAGTIHINGGINFQAGSTFNQSGGVLEIDPNDGTAAGSLTTTAFLSATNNINCTAGIIRFIDPIHISNTNYNMSPSVSVTANTYFTGTHTIELGDGISTTVGGGNGFRMYSFAGAGYAPYNNIVVNGGTGFGRWMLNGTTAFIGTLTINNGSTLRHAGTLYCGGNIVNNGLFASTATLTFGAPNTYAVTNAQSISGTGTFRNTIPAQSSISAAGTGYAVGDVITLAGGTFTTPATFYVTTVNGTGGITGAVGYGMGSYTVAPANPVATTGGAGTGATLNFAAAASPAPAGYPVATANLSSITINNTGTTGVTFNLGNLKYSNTLTFTKGKMLMGNNTLIQVAGAGLSGSAQTTGWVVGKFQKNAGTGAINHTYPVGDANYYTPVVIAGAAGSVTTAGDIVVGTTTGEHPNIAGSGVSSTKGVNRYYTITTDGTIAFAPGSLTTTLNWNAADLDAGAATASFIAGKYSAGTWTLPTVASPTATSIQVTGLSSFSDFIVGQAFNPLTVKLDNISATNVNTRNRVDWNTRSENNGDLFTIERSTDGRSFTQIGTVPAKGMAANYSYWDMTPAKGINYYRLKMSDANSKVSYSRVVNATVNTNTSFGIEAFPNPVADFVTVNIHGTKADNATITVTDITGKIMAAVPVNSDNVKINMSNLPQGIYIINYNDNNNAQTFKLGKQ